MNACETHNPLTCIDMSVDQSVLLCSVYAFDTVCEFDLCVLSSLNPLLLTTVFTVSSTVSGGDSKCILYSNRITNAYVPKTYSNANNIYTLYSIYSSVSIRCSNQNTYSIDERERSCASHVYTLYSIKEY